MTNSFLIISVLLLCAFTPIYTTHDSFEKVDREFTNFEEDVQSQQFTVVNTTPNLTDLKSGEFNIYMATGIPQTVNLILRVGTTMYVSPNWTLIKGR